MHTLSNHVLLSPPLGALLSCVGLAFILFGRHFQPVCVFACTFFITGESVFAVMQRADVDFIAFPMAYAAVLASGFVSALCSIFFLSLRKFFAGMTLGLMMFKLLGPLLFLVVPPLALSFWLALGLGLACAVWATFTEGVHQLVPTIFGALIFVIGCDVVSSKRVLLGHHEGALYDAVVCHHTGNTQACIALFALWPVLALLGIVFQTLFPTSRLHSFYERLAGAAAGYHTIPDSEPAAEVKRSRKTGRPRRLPVI